MHCDAPKWVPDPFPSINPSVKTSKLPLPMWPKISSRCIQVTKSAYVDRQCASPIGPVLWTVSSSRGFPFDLAAVSVLQ